MADNAPSGYSELLEEYERTVGRPQAGMTMRPDEFPRHADVDVVGVNGQQVPRQRLTFESPPPVAEEPNFDQRIEGVLAPFRERFDAAQDLLVRKTAEVEQALSMRHDLERAAASVRNVETGTPRQPSLPSPKACMAMSDAAWEAFKDEHR